MCTFEPQRLLGIITLRFVLASYYWYLTDNQDVSVHKGNFIPTLPKSIRQLFLYSFPGNSFIISTAFHQIFASV